MEAWGALFLLAALFVWRRSSGTGPPNGGPPQEKLHPTIRARVEEFREVVAVETDGLPNVSVALAMAVIARETGGMNRRGNDGEAGLMQVTADAWTDYQMAQNDPDANPFPDALDSPNIGIRVGSWYLNRKIEDMRGNVYEGLRAYNCGTRGATENPTCGAAYAEWVQTIGEPAFRGGPV